MHAASERTKHKKTLRTHTHKSITSDIKKRERKRDGIFAKLTRATWYTRIISCNETQNQDEKCENWKKIPKKESYLNKIV